MGIWSDTTSGDTARDVLLPISLAHHVFLAIYHHFRLTQYNKQNNLTFHRLQFLSSIFLFTCIFYSSIQTFHRNAGHHDSLSCDTIMQLHYTAYSLTKLSLYSILIERLAAIFQGGLMAFNFIQLNLSRISLGIAFITMIILFWCFTSGRHEANNRCGNTSPSWINLVGVVIDIGTVHKLFSRFLGTLVKKINCTVHSGQSVFIGFIFPSFMEAQFIDSSIRNAISNRIRFSHSRRFHSDSDVDGGKSYRRVNFERLPRSLWVTQESDSVDNYRSVYNYY